MTASIAREHLHGATIWAFGGGGVVIKTWDTPQYYSRFRGETA